MSTGRTIMDLDDYSLCHVFSFLSNLRDIATVGYTCLRFRSIIGSLIGKRGITHNWLLWRFDDVKRFYANYGIYVKKIYIKLYFGEDEICHLISKYCHNIETATVDFSDNADAEFLENMLASNKSIKRILLNSPYITDIVCEHISRLQSLEIFILKSCNNFTGEHLYRLTSLKELNLERCRKLNSDHFIGICKANKLLKLNIVGCLQLNTEAFRTLVETQTELEEIHVDGWYESGEVSQIVLLENLRKMRIRYNYGLKENSKSLLKELSEHRASSLKYLKIDCQGVGPPLEDLESIKKFENLEKLFLSGATNLDDSVLTQISEACKRLQAFGVRYSQQITNEGILQLIRNLKHLTVLGLENSPSLRDELYHDMCEAKRTSDGKIKLKVHADNPFLDYVTEEQLRMNQDLVQLFYDLKPFCVSQWNDVYDTENISSRDVDFGF